MHTHTHTHIGKAHTIADSTVADRSHIQRINRFFTRVRECVSSYNTRYEPHDKRDGAKNNKHTQTQSHRYDAPRPPNSVRSYKSVWKPSRIGHHRHYLKFSCCLFAARVVSIHTLFFRRLVVCACFTVFKHSRRVQLCNWITTSNTVFAFWEEIVSVLQQLLANQFWAFYFLEMLFLDPFRGRERETWVRARGK